MTGASRKVNFYRLALEKGSRYRMTLSEDDCLTGMGGGLFCYRSQVFDSQDPDGTWHRLVLEGTFRDCKYEITVAATNADLRDLMEETESMEEQLNILKEQAWTRKVNTPDFLLHGIQGRYLWVFIRATGARLDSSFRIEGFHVEFPQGSFIEYLPEIYQESGRNSFFERYLTVFQSLYEDLEHEVERIPEYLDYETAPDKNLPLFAAWTGSWDAGYEYRPQQMRYLLRNLQKIQSGRGTRQTLEQMIRIFTGKDAVIIEYFKWHDWMEKESSMEEIYERLFGRSEDTFTVILDMSDKSGDLSRGRLLDLLEAYVPLGMHCNLVLLEKNSRMDGHCYLDRNGCLSTPAAADAGGFGLDGNYILS
jgi:phage tail-like protein